MQHHPSRRKLLKTIGAAAGAAVAARGRASGQTPSQTPQGPPSVVTIPPRDFGPNAPPTTYFTDPDVLTIDPRFDAYVQANTPIKRLWTGALWGEGPAGKGEGRQPLGGAIPHDRLRGWAGTHGR